MTQYSMPWTCVNIGDGGPGSYSLEVVETMNRIFGNLSATDSGVIYWTDTDIPNLPGMANPVGGTPPEDFLLTPKLIPGNQVHVEPGVGMVKGWAFVNDTVRGFLASGGNANAVDVVGLRMELIAQTVRIFYGRGAASSTYVLDQSSATWEIPLAYIQLDGAGNPTSLTDVRRFITTPLYPPQKHSMVYPVSIGIASAALTPVIMTTNQWPPFNASYEFGIPLSNAEDRGAFYIINVPPNIVGTEIDFQPIIWSSDSAPVGNVVYRYYIYNPLDRGVAEVNSGLFTLAATVQGAAFPTWNDIVTTNAIVVPDTPYVIVLERLATNVADTYTGTMVTNGIRVMYNRQYPDTFYDTLPIQ